MKEEREKLLLFRKIPPSVSQCFFRGILLNSQQLGETKETMEDLRFANFSLDSLDFLSFFFLKKAIYKVAKQNFYKRMNI